MIIVPIKIGLPQLSGSGNQVHGEVLTEGVFFCFHDKVLTELAVVRGHLKGDFSACRDERVSVHFQ